MDLKLHNLRIKNITRINPAAASESDFFSTLDLKDGLGIERQCSTNNETYYVVAFVHYNTREECAEIEVVGNRILDLEDSEFKDFKKLAHIAIEMVELANIEDNGEN